MPTFGLFFLLVGTLLIRQVITGRTTDTPTDLKDLAVATLSGDAVAMQEVLQRRGVNAGVESGGMAAPDNGSTPVISRDFQMDHSERSAALLATAQRMGQSAKGYQWGAVGPTYYDCSGLVWRACRTLNIYSGARFTTTTLGAVAGNFATKVDDFAVGDIVCWPGKHMGIVSSPTDYYSARSVSKGIGHASLKDDTDYFSGVAPEYWRIK